MLEWLRRNAGLIVLVAIIEIAIFAAGVQHGVARCVAVARRLAAARAAHAAPTAAPVAKNPNDAPPAIRHYKGGRLVKEELLPTATAEANDAP